MLFHIVIPRENLETEYFSKYIVTTYSGQRVYNDTMKTTFLFKFRFLSGFFSKLQVTSKQREAFLCIHVYVYYYCLKGL